MTSRGIAARTMRRVLVDYWSHRNAKKRLEGGERVPLEDACGITGGPARSAWRALDR